MKERPILFSAPMVCALLAGTKTQTRRAGKPVRHPDLGNLYDIGAFVLEHEPQHVIERACPYGQPGDQLWVRETWAEGATRTMYRAGCNPEYKPLGGKWRPSIHMPRWASRIQLEITAVRVERLQAISKTDAIAEGLDRFNLNGSMYWRDYSLSDDDAECSPMRECPIESYRTLWEQINGAGSWAATPWVWVVEFKVLKGGAA